jgi:predicted RNA binding protein YcfA (HicA-like mRNA interferase family)
MSALPHSQHLVQWEVPRDADQCCVKVRDVISMIERDGWVLVRTRGSHRQFRHPAKPGTVTIAGKLGVDMPRGTFKSVLKQAALEE